MPTIVTTTTVDGAAVLASGTLVVAAGQSVSLSFLGMTVNLNFREDGGPIRSVPNLAGDTASITLFNFATPMGTAVSIDGFMLNDRPLTMKLAASSIGQGINAYMLIHYTVA